MVIGSLSAMAEKNSAKRIVKSTLHKLGFQRKHSRVMVKPLRGKPFKRLKNCAMNRILFVCLGNICRSPAAEGVLRYHLEQAGLTDKFYLDSAGLNGLHAGSPPDRRMVAAAADRGISLDGIIARPFHPSDFGRYDYVIGMDLSHLNALERMKPKDSRASVSLLMDHAENPRAREVPDPYYGEGRDFEYALDLIETGVDALLSRLGH